MLLQSWGDFHVAPTLQQHLRTARHPRRSHSATLQLLSNSVTHALRMLK